jgi:hypothetical protein
MDKNSDDQEVFHLAALRANFSACDMKILSQYNWGILDLLYVGVITGFRNAKKPVLHNRSYK